MKDLLSTLGVLVVIGAISLFFVFPCQMTTEKYKDAIVIDKTNYPVVGNVCVLKVDSHKKYVRFYDIVFNKISVGDTLIGDSLK